MDTSSSGAPFGDVLKELRNRRRLSRRELGERTGNHPNTIANWERGDVLPDRAKVAELIEPLTRSKAEEVLLLEAYFGFRILPSVHNMPPYGRNPFFTGREELLEQLHHRLAPGSQTALTQAISGLGGIGKTQVALEYVYRHQRHYSHVLWVTADSQETLITEFGKLAKDLDLPEKNEKDQNRVVAAVRRWLREYVDWLLILDNVEDLSLVTSTSFIPPGYLGAVLLTTQLQVTEPVAQVLELDVFSEDEGVFFLLRRARRLALDGTPAEEAMVARAITQQLGGLPLALDQAGAYIAENRCSLSHYLDLFKQRQTALLLRRGTVPSDHPQSVSTTFSLAFEQVQQKNEPAIELLKLCACLAPDAIPLELITQGAIHLGTILETVAADALQLDQTLETLQAYSLVRRDGENRTLSLHRLVQAVLSDAMTEQEREQWKQRAVQAVSAASPNVQDVEQWDACDQWVPHVLVCAIWIQKERLDSEESASLLNRAAYYLDDRARYSEAEPLYLLALAIREQQLGVERPEIASSLNNLALLYMNQGKYAEAEPLLKRALTICEQWLRAEHPDTTPTLMDQAVLYIKQGKYAEAKPLLKRALATREQELGAMHPDTAQSLNNLAALYEEQQGKYAEAELLLKRALAICEQWLGAEHPDTTLLLINKAVLTLNDMAVLILNDMALLYFNQEKYTEAEPLYLRGLKICEQRLGAEHPNTALILNNLGALCVKQGKYAEAEPLLKRSLTIREQQARAQPLDMAQSLNSLATLYKSQRRYAEAEPLLKRALTIYEHVLGSEHPLTQKILKNYTLLLQEMEGNGPKTEIRAKIGHRGNRHKR